MKTASLKMRGGTINVSFLIFQIIQLVLDPAGVGTLFSSS